MQSIILNILPDKAIILWQGRTFIRVLAEIDLAKRPPAFVRRIRIMAMFALAEHGIERVRALLAEHLSPDELAADRGLADVPA